MNDDRLDRTDNQELTTADIASAGDDSSRPSRALHDREVGLQRGASRADVDAEPAQPLLPEEMARELRPRWADIQASFVDSPRQSVEEADRLVADAMKRLAEAFATTRSGLERDWDSGEDVSTEDLRVALRRYRAFFDRLLDV